MKVSRMNSGVSRRNQGENQMINDNVRDVLDVDLANENGSKSICRPLRGLLDSVKCDLD